MTHNNIATLYDIRSRFLRSTNLQRDFYDPDSLSSYILTDHAIECISRIAEGTRKRSSQRAWRITGDYGSGKSNFALFLAHWLCDDEKELPVKIKQQLESEDIHKGNQKYYPLLITGSRESMGKAILDALLSLIQEHFDNPPLKNKIIKVSAYALNPWCKIPTTNIGVLLLPAAASAIFCIK